MYTHLFVSNESADMLFAGFARKPLERGEKGVVTRSTCAEHFKEFGQAYLAGVGAILESRRADDMYSLNFDDYLPRVPQVLIDLNIPLVKVELVRLRSAPTRAHAGYYEDPKTGCEARVERVFPEQRFSDFRKPPVPLYAQNIKITGPSLAAVQKFNSKLSTGYYNRFLVNAFE